MSPFPSMARSQMWLNPVLTVLIDELAETTPLTASISSTDPLPWLVVYILPFPSTTVTFWAECEVLDANVMGALPGKTISGPEPTPFSSAVATTLPDPSSTCTPPMRTPGYCGLKTTPTLHVCPLLYVAAVLQVVPEEISI